MDNEFKDFTATPTLTFDVAPETKEAPAPTASSELAEQAADPAFSENNLTPEELQMVNEFSQKIDLHNSQAILQYGVGTQKKMADFSEAALNNVRTKDLGEVGNMLIRFVTSHPKDMSDDTLRVIAAHNNICKYIHLPAQSGSSKILKVMNRKYTREWYLDRIAAIRRIVPEASIATDLFCGFHSETEEDYQETLSLMREVKYDAAFLFKYSERPGTYAAKHLPDTVEEEEKVRRLQGMIDLQNQLSEESNLRDVGKEFEVLVEGFSKRSREQLFGRTSQNKVVIFDKKNYKVGQFVKVRITRASSATLFGETIE